MHLTKAPGYSASIEADLALAALENGMESNDDDFKFGYNNSAGSEKYMVSNFSAGFYISTVFLFCRYNVKSANDPRLTATGHSLPSPDPAYGPYHGRVIGTQDIGSLESYSIPSDFYAGAGAYN